MITISQPDISKVVNKSFNAFFAASGFESRASFQAVEYKIQAEHKMVFGFNNAMDHERRIENDSKFKNLDFESKIINNESDNYQIFIEILTKIIDNANGNQPIEIYIDYSSMSRNWYAFILFAVNNLKNGKQVILTFGYSHAKYVKYDGQDTLNRIVEPLKGFCNLSIPSKPTALIICLGNEPNRVDGLREYFDSTTYLFYSDENYNSEFCEEIEQANQDFINSINKERIIKFPVFDLIYTNYLLESLCKVLLSEFRIILAPCGPKPFALLSMVNSLKYENAIEVWRISPGDKLSQIDRIPTGLISILEVVMN